MNDTSILFGTDAAAPNQQIFSFHDLSFTIEALSIKNICVEDTEILREIAFLVRDADWGTVYPMNVSIKTLAPEKQELIISAVYENHGARLTVSVMIRYDERSFRVCATADAEGDFETNRTGFTVLHPLSVSGCPAIVKKIDGEVVQSSFPELIDPWQPFKNFNSIIHEAEGYRVECELIGDTFEMEDQRQWGDASFKTYNRPLAEPWPYVILSDESVHQSVSVNWKTCELQKLPSLPAIKECFFPEMALVLDANDAETVRNNRTDLLKVHPQRLLCHIDCELGDLETQISRFAALQSTFGQFIYDVELICKFDVNPREELKHINNLFILNKFCPDSILVCPSVDRQSTPPGSVWPECPPLEEIYSTASEVFSNSYLGGGMVSFFPELNRKRPPLDHIRFVSHGLCPIIHAADDVSVMQTLDTIPFIIQTARSFIKDRDYRIGPSTIAMRQNPYGSKTFSNPLNQRICMTHDDPRHKARFGAAYLLGLAARLASSGVKVWTPCAVTGPRGLNAANIDLLTHLSKMSGAKVLRADFQNEIATLVAGGQKLEGNLSYETRGKLGPYEWHNQAI
jgi:hypothetical protein